jgi:hypothetical protein
MCDDQTNNHHTLQRRRQGAPNSLSVYALRVDQFSKGAFKAQRPDVGSSDEVKKQTSQRVPARRSTSRWLTLARRWHDQANTDLDQDQKLSSLFSFDGLRPPGTAPGGPGVGCTANQSLQRGDSPRVADVGSVSGHAQPLPPLSREAPACSASTGYVSPWVSPWLQYAPSAATGPPAMSAPC